MFRNFLKSLAVVPALLLGMGTPLAAQTLTNHGARLTVQAGTTLAVPDSLLNRTGSQLTNHGTLQLGRTLNNAGTLASTGLMRFAGSSRQRMVPGGATLAQLEVNNTGLTSQGMLVITDDLAVAQQLRLINGMVHTSSGKTISLPAGAALLGEAPGRYVQGNLRITRAAVNGPTDFGHGVWLDGTGHALGEISVTRTAGLRTADLSYGNRLGSTTKGIDRIWTITAAQSPNAAVPLRLSWLADDDNGLTNFSQAQVWRQASPAASWETTGPRTDASARSISTTVAAFGRFTVSNAANPLPVELISFTAERRGADALLQWATASEKNSSYFAVESSPDGRVFRQVGQVSSRGTAITRSDYQFIDPNLARYAVQTVYYRLRQVDQDGTETYSPVRTVAVPTQSDLVVQAWPNPFGDEALSVLVNTPQAGTATVELTDAVGRSLFSQRAVLIKGTNTLSLPQAAQLPEGVYLVRVQHSGQQRTLKLVRR